jgi:hypothetical protein
LRDDPRYERKTLEQAFIGKPTGRPLVAGANRARRAQGQLAGRRAIS